MANRKRTQGQTTICKTLHRKLKIEQHESNSSWSTSGTRRVCSSNKPRDRSRMKKWLRNIGEMFNMDNYNIVATEKKQRNNKCVCNDNLYE
jgi:hypothetical protein